MEATIQRKVRNLGTLNKKKLLPLMFEVGRLLKSEITREGCPITTFLHIETLRFIAERSTPTMSDVAEYLKIAPPTATSLINTFVKEGMIERVEDPKDRRRVRLILSKKGIHLLDQAMKMREHAFSRVMASLSDRDCHELARILTVITRTT